MKKWFDDNQLALNIGKTNYVIFHSHAKNVTDLSKLNFVQKG